MWWKGTCRTVRRRERVAIISVHTQTWFSSTYKMPAQKWSDKSFPSMIIWCATIGLCVWLWRTYCPFGISIHLVGCFLTCRCWAVIRQRQSARKQVYQVWLPHRELKKWSTCIIPHTKYQPTRIFGCSGWTNETRREIHLFLNLASGYRKQY